MTLKTLKFSKIKKKREKYGQIAKILADSVSAGPIYVKHSKNQKSDTKNFSIKTRNV